jgi:hypothetical protein
MESIANFYGIKGDGKKSDCNLSIVT